MDENTQAEITDSASDTTSGELEVSQDQMTAPVVEDNTSDAELTDPFDGIWSEDEADDTSTSDETLEAEPTDDTAETFEEDSRPEVDTPAQESPSEESQPTEDRDDTEPRKPSNVEKRFSKLTSEKKDLQAQVDQLQQLVAQQKDITPQTTTSDLQKQMQLAAQIEAQKVALQANARAVEAEERAVEDEVVHQARVDWLTAVQNNDVLNPKSNKHIPAVAQRLTTVINKTLKTNPYQSVAEIIDDYLYVGKVSAGARAQEISTQISQQMASQAIPAGSTRGSSSLTLEQIENMDLDEFEQRKPEIDRFMRNNYKG